MDLETQWCVALAYFSQVLRVGLRLTDYRLAHPVAAAQPLNYTEILLTDGILRFSFTVEIAESPEQFGGAHPSFSNKKDAKRYAAKKAIDWLSERKHIQLSDNSNSSSESPITIAEALEAEKIAREEIGSMNWYGKLIGVFSLVYTPPVYCLL